MKLPATCFTLYLTGLILSATADAGSHATSINAPLLPAQLGPRPFYLVDNMDESALKDQLSECADRRPFYRRSDFSIGHRGAPLQFPEHTRESYIAAARMGAGIIECDVTFTQDRELVCRHSQCDLHTTTNILQTPLAEKCTQDFQPAEYDPLTGELIRAASAQCCTSDITLAEFKSLKGKMDGANNRATTRAEYLAGTAGWRTDTYSQGTLLSHKESIELIASLGAKFTPELKSPQAPMPFQGDYTQEDYAQQMIDEYRAAGISPRKVFAQSFNLADVKYWLANEPAFGRQAVYLDDRYEQPSFDFRNPATYEPSMAELVADGVKIIAPPMWMLLDTSSEGKIIPSTYAKEAKQAGLKMITWTLERSAPLENDGAWYHQSTDAVVNNDGDKLVSLHVLAKDVGIIGIFSDWPATTTFYANCMNLR
ncbi:glycerophosphodiester phosphodiesterase family protein [Simiduia agarivorans]|uniref:glycerophosphodiester phosphodiesterase n=1 Tax=Simiduia agarivorans (strain DSM 21679 / JCM 13881 / BCRC 17597 / SA1) TaxID=1117647 RepID=K4KKS1_SIMAS|nr:glycerophosphodiester phosphodiesterase family protein [Simiduia agarivorans]AFU98820.1 glycerophosphoryl diester phosphodiesterase [Simiduia agarivorans SA1 = DSM 21679]